MNDEWLKTKKLPVRMIAAGGMVWKDDKVLLIKTSMRGWEFPGGVVEDGEAIIDGLQREIIEECGILVKPLRLIGIYQGLNEKNGYGPLEGMILPPTICYDFICEYIGEAHDDNIHDEMAWVTPDEARKLVTYGFYPERLKNMLELKDEIVLATFNKTEGEAKISQLTYLKEE